MKGTTQGLVKRVDITILSTPPSASEESKFMANLMEGLDDSFWNALPSPEPSPVKPTRRPLPKTPLKISSPFPKPSAPSPSKRFDAGNIDMVDFLAGAEDWDLDSDPFTPKKASPKKIVSSSFSQSDKYQPDDCTRCIVESIAEINLNGRWSKKLGVKVDSKPKTRGVQLNVFIQDDWFDTDIRIGDTINVIGPFLANSIHINSQSNILILHPDILLTATALSNAPQCRRKPLLSSLVRSNSDISPALVWGSMLHEVMQQCMQEQRWEESWICERIEEVVQQGLGDLIALDVTVGAAEMELLRRARGLQKFKERYISDIPKADAILTDTRSGINDSPALLAISKLLEIEEDIWSPTYGLKGKLDATVQTVISETPPPPPKNPFSYKSTSKYSGGTTSKIPPLITNGPRPFEIKTGRTLAGMEHRAQTMLYTVLASERYGVDVPAGLLYYTQSDEVVRVPRTRNEMRGLMIARNELAGYMMRRIRKKALAMANSGVIADVTDKTEGTPTSGVEEPFLPLSLDDSHICKRCYALDTCMLYRFASSIESKPESNNPMYDTFQLKTGHLTASQGEFFRKWENLLALEEQDLVRFKKELWTIGAADREKMGRCFAGMVLKDSIFPVNLEPTVGESNIHKFTYRFVRSSAFVSSSPSTSSGGSNLLGGHLNVGDAITLSVEPHLLALARGFITDLRPDVVEVGVDHAVDLSIIRGRMCKGKDQGYSQSEVIFRIDKDELFGGMGRMRNNLAQLFYADGDKRRLELIVDLREPTFSEMSPLIGNPYIRHLNPSQCAAMEKVLSADDYAVILGMPGTGKTTVVAALIQTLVEDGKSVLLTSYTHSAVDTILRKLDDANFGILRLGNLDKIHPDVRKYTLNGRKKATTIEQVEYQWMTPPVVAATCLSIDHPLFKRRKFDYCIVDEASQITLPTCLGPLRFVDKFVLVGDHFQLPPLVKNPEARRGGLDVSLFRRLSDAHPQSVVNLCDQYRMNADIMLLSNRLIYNNNLRCGSEEVAKRNLILPNPKFLEKLHTRKKMTKCKEGNCWLESLASERCKAVFVDTDSIPARDSRVGDLVQNEIEAELVRQVTETFLRSGVEEDQIGIISLYRQQVKLLSNLLQERKGVEILTADKSQGRDKDCIIISLVRSNDENLIGELVKDWRRMNVSFTRARSKLIIFGSRKTLQEAPLLEGFFKLMDGQGWIFRLSEGAHLVHAGELKSVGVVGFVGDAVGCGGVLGKRRSEELDGECRMLEGEGKGGGEGEIDGEVEGGDNEMKVDRGMMAVSKKLMREVKGKENVVLASKANVGEGGRPQKRMKGMVLKRPGVAVEEREKEKGGKLGKMEGTVGVLRGRPILQDLVKNEI